MARRVPFLLVFVGALVLPLAALLFLQWPLREWVQAYSREANDLAQIVFACYVAVGVAVASWQGVHLTAKVPPHFTAKSKSWRDVAIPMATALCVGPWAIFMLWSCLPSVMQSVASGERFAETLNPGYFAIRLSMVLMLVCILGWPLVQLCSAYSSGRDQGP
jgi:hypothetical protein